MSVTKIVLTGGPCGGKSTCISTLEQDLTDKGYQVFIVEEMATNVILSGASAKNIGDYEFQKMLIKLQYFRNKVYDEMAENFSKQNNKNVVIIYDRGIQDGKAFVSDETWEKLLKDIGLDEVKIMDYYDGVFNLVTAADGAIEAYTCDNNKARTETPEQAVERDKACIKAWTGHNHLRIIDNKNKTFSQKIDNLKDEIYTLLGIPVPVEIERKYLVKMPNISELEKRYACKTVDIIQTYLVSNEAGVERRVRQRGTNGQYTFYYTEKVEIDSKSRYEKERKISQQEYLSLLVEADTRLHTIVKRRTCFVCNDTYFELDVYPFWNDYAILEVELTKKDQEISLDLDLDIIQDVTEDKRFKNRALAENYGNIEID